MLKNEKLVILFISLLNILLLNCECQKSPEGNSKQELIAKTNQKPITKDEELIAKEKEQLILEENQLMDNLKKQYNSNSWQAYEKELKEAKNDMTKLADIINSINGYFPLLEAFHKGIVGGIPTRQLKDLCNWLNTIEGINIDSELPRGYIETIIGFNKDYFIKKATTASQVHLEVCKNFIKQMELEKKGQKINNNDTPAGTK